MAQGGSDNPHPAGRPPERQGDPPGPPAPGRTPPPTPGSSGTHRPVPPPGPSGSRVGHSAKSGKSLASSNVQIGSYRILERIGAGGMGAVYRAVHVELDREVAIKLMPPHMNSNPIMVARFKREARAAAQLQHENIVQIYDVDVDPERGNHYLALEFVRGSDLSDVIARKKRLAVPVAVDYLKQAARALDHAFRKGIVHRDIKPSNFLITPEGKVKLCDMGLALRTDAGDESKVTRDGTTVGTVDYMAPEQAKDSRLADTRSDIYSLGCTLYQMLTGRVPFEHGSIPEKLYKHAHESPPDPLQFNPDVPGSVLYILGRMMEKRPADRYQTPQELLDELDQLDLAGDTAKDSSLKTLAIGIEADDAEPEVVIERRSRLDQLRLDQRRRTQRKWLIIGGVAAVAVLLVGMVSWLATRAPGTPALRGPSGGLAGVPSPARSVTAAAPARGSGAAAPPAAPSRTDAAGQGLAAPRPPTATAPAAPAAVPPTSVSKQPAASPAAAAAASATETAASVPAVPAKPPVEPKITAEERARIEQQFFSKWSGMVRVPDTPVTVARGTQQETAGVFNSLEAACRKAKTEGSKIQIEDNGPLFERSFTVHSSNLDIRPRNSDKLSYRPIVAFDAGSSRGNPQPYFLQAKQSNIYIEGVDFVVYGPDLVEMLQTKPFYFFDVQGGDLTLKNCTFTVIGKHQSVSLIRLSGQRPADAARTPPQLARLSIDGCLARGEPLTAISLSAGAADIEVKDSLLVRGGNGVLFDVTAPTDPGPTPKRTIRFIRSTLVSRSDFLAMEGTTPIPTEIKVLDSVIACNANNPHKLMRTKGWPTQAGGLTSVSLDELGTLYTGWETLLSTGVGGSVVAKSAEAWAHAWRHDEPRGHVKEDAWPSEELADLSRIVPASFNVAEIAAGVSSGLGEESIGCPVDRLTTPTPMLLERTYGDIAAPPLISLSTILPSTTLDPQKNGRLAAWRAEQDRRRNSQAVPKPEPRDPVLELKFNADTDGGDLGKFLAGQELPETTTVTVTGAGGSYATSPIRLPGKKSLVLWVQQTGRKPIAFTPAATDPPAEALFDVRDGDLIIDGADFLYPVGSATGLPRRFIKVARGNLTLNNCRFYGPMQPGSGLEELLAFSGGPQQAVPPKPAGAAKPANPPSEQLHLDFHPAPNASVSVCQLIDCYLACESRCLSAVVSQAIVRFTNTVAVTPGSLAAIDLGQVSPDDFSAAVLLDHNSFAVSRAFFEVGSWLATRLPAQPLLFTSRDNLFCDPFDVGTGATARVRTSVLLRYGGRTLQQGLIAWQASHDAYGRDLHSYLLPNDVKGQRQYNDFDPNWLLVWGRSHVRDCLVDPKGDRIRFEGKTLKLRDLERDKDPSVLTLQSQCEAAKRASDGGPIGADIRRLVH